MPDDKSTLEGIEEKFGSEKDKAEQGLDEYIDKKVDEKVQERVRSAVPWMLALGAGLFVAWTVTRNGREATP